MRERHEEIRALGADIVAIGTGDTRYAAAFVCDEGIPYLVLVDDDARAAEAAAVKNSSFVGMFTPRTWNATYRTMRRGHKIHKAGKRVTQLGATFVIEPGDRLVYEHIDDDSTDHALADTVIGVLRARR